MSGKSRDVTSIGREKPLDEFIRKTSPKGEKAQGLPKESHKRENPGPLFHWTGHPFTDAGLTALLIMSNKISPTELTADDVMNAIEFISELYLKEGWSTLLARIYRNNNPILMINPSMRKGATPDKLKFSLVGLYKLLVNTSQKKSQNVCQICGRYPALSGIQLRSILNTKEKERPKEITGDIFPLLGTGDLRNYFPHGYEMGADICAHCLLLVQLFPTASYVITSKKGKTKGILVLHTYPYKKNVELAKDAVLNVKKSFVYNTARGVGWPVDLMFQLIQEISLKVDLGYWTNVSISGYYFLNGNRTGEQWVHVIEIPNPVLRFIAYAAKYDFNGWKKLSSMYLKKTRRNGKNNEYSGLSSKEIYPILLSGESILPYFIDRKNRRTNTKWSLLTFYCLEVLGLDKDALDFVKKVSDKIVETIEKLPDNKLARRVRELERAEKLYQFESFFIRVEKDRLEHGIKGSLMGFDDFARILTNYGEDLNVSWKTVKNLILFRIYEKLHDRLMKASEEFEASEDEEFEEGGGEE